ncbi:arsenic metallochaperone ArsD family protein [Paenibacillus sp. ISL-20]|nr:arsenic metallochaperone ArsD family protein [Paenibacillus sp. ISL-20]
MISIEIYDPAMCCSTGVVTKLFFGGKIAHILYSFK